MKRSISLLAILMVASLVTGCFGFLGFGADTYSVEVTWNEEMGNVVLPDNLDEIEDGTKITLKAEPKEGYEFVAWRGDADSTDLELEIVVEADLEIEAIFKEEGALDPVSVQVNWDDKMGNVKLPENLNQVTPGTTIKLVAEPAANHGFVEWKGEGVPEDSTELTLEIVVEVDMEIEAVFMLLGVESFEGFDIGHELLSMGGGAATVAVDPLDENNQVLKYENGNYNCVPVIKLTLPEGKTLADYDNFSFKGYFAQGDVGWKDIGVAVFMEEPEGMIAMSGSHPNKIGVYNRAEGAASEWQDFTIDIADSEEDGGVLLEDISGEFYVGFGIHAGSSTEIKDDEGEVIEVIDTIWYADDVTFK